jgi:hypothetical protein
LGRAQDGGPNQQDQGAGKKEYQQWDHGLPFRTNTSRSPFCGRRTI